MDYPVFEASDSTIKAYKEAMRLEPDSTYPKNAIEKVKRKQEKLKEL